MVTNITLRQVGLVSLGMTVPVEFTRSLGLRAGDIVSWSAEGDTATLKFRVTRTEEKRGEEADGGRIKNGPDARIQSQ